MKTVSFLVVLWSCIIMQAAAAPDNSLHRSNNFYNSTMPATGNNDSVPASARDMDIVASDGVKLRATYYSPGKPGPGILLLHQCNMDRKCWQVFAGALAQQGIHVLTFDYRGYGETPKTGGYEKLAGDVDTALAVLMSLPQVNRHNIAAGGASCGVNNAVSLAQRNPAVKALLLLSGPVSKDGLEFLRKHPGLAIFGAASSEEDFAVKAINEMVATSTNTASTMKQVQNAGHGAPMFTAEPSLLKDATGWVAAVLK